MENLRFCFDHPVKGHASLTLLQKAAPLVVHRQQFDTRESNELIISMQGYPQGKWGVVLEWEYEDRYFSHKREFDWHPEENLFQAAKYARADLQTDKSSLFSTCKYAAAD